MLAMHAYLAGEGGGTTRSSGAVTPHLGWHVGDEVLLLSLQEVGERADHLDLVGREQRPIRQLYLLRATFMSTWGFWPAVFRPLRTVFPGLGAGFLNPAGKTEGTAKAWGKNGKKWARNGLKRVGVS